MGAVGGQRKASSFQLLVGDGSTLLKSCHGTDHMLVLALGSWLRWEWGCKKEKNASLVYRMLGSFQGHRVLVSSLDYCLLVGVPLTSGPWIEKSMDLHSDVCGVLANSLIRCWRGLSHAQILGFWQLSGELWQSPDWAARAGI